MARGAKDVPKSDFMSGEILTAEDLNDALNTWIENAYPEKIDDYSDTVSMMQITQNPLRAGSALPPVNLAQELGILRYQVGAITGEPHRTNPETPGPWYNPPEKSIAVISDDIAEVESDITDIEDDIDAINATLLTINTSASGSNTFLGTAAPKNSQGSAGDIYIRTSNANIRFYKKQSNNTWPSSPNATATFPSGGGSGTPGADGADGTIIRAGSATPLNNLGNNDDFYIKADGDEVTIYKRVSGSYVQQAKYDAKINSLTSASISLANDSLAFSDANDSDTNKKTKAIELFKKGWVNNLTALTKANLSTSNDMLAVLDSSTLTTKKISVTDLVTKAAPASGNSGPALPAFPDAGSRNGKVPKFDGNTLKWLTDATGSGGAPATTSLPWSAITSKPGQVTAIPALPANGSRDAKFLGFNSNSLQWGKVSYNDLTDKPASSDVVEKWLWYNSAGLSIVSAISGAEATLSENFSGFRFIKFLVDSSSGTDLAHVSYELILTPAQIETTWSTVTGGRLWIGGSPNHYVGVWGEDNTLYLRQLTTLNLLLEGIIGIK